MKKGGGAGKGSDFERTIAKAFSRWWTEGKREDVFWRTAGSGAMATARGRRGKSAAFQEGDLAATDPIGTPFTTLYCVEIKRGYGRWGLIDLLDAPQGAAVQTFTRFWTQAFLAARSANPARIPLLVVRRDRRTPLIILPLSHARVLFGSRRPPDPSLILYSQVGTVIAMGLRAFFDRVWPQHIRDLAEELS